MTDAFATVGNVEWGPYENAFAITPAAGALTNVTRAIYVGGAGDVTATIGGTTVTFKAPPVGTILPVRATHVTAATTATLLIGLY